MAHPHGIQQQGKPKVLASAPRLPTLSSGQWITMNIVSTNKARCGGFEPLTRGN